MFGGYTLMYAAIANGGKYYPDPWKGLIADAYTDQEIYNYPGSVGPVVPVPQTPVPRRRHPISG